MGFDYNIVIKKILLNKLNYMINIHVNEQTLYSMIPINIKLWINDQFDYIFNNKNTIDYELFMLLINHSMKMFNYLIDSSKISKNEIIKVTKIWNDININYKDGISKVINFINNSPKCNSDFVVYSGINYDDFNRFNVNPYYINNRFMSTSFDKLHALKYSRERRINKTDNLFLLKIKVTKNTPCIYTVYENQVVFPPNIKIQFVSSKLKYMQYKDILDTELSKKIYLVVIITIVLFK